MYFWRVESLKQEMRHGPLAARTAFAYLIAGFLVLELMIGVPGLWNVEPATVTTWSWVVYLLGAAVFVLATYAAYRANGGAAGQDFAARYLALGWVLGIRFFVLGLAVLLVAFIAVIVVGAASGPAAMEPDFVDRLLPQWSIDTFFLIFSGVFYWRLVHHFRTIAGASNAPATGGLPAA